MIRTMFAILLLFSALALSSLAQDTKTCPLHEQHMKAAAAMEHHDAMNASSDEKFDAMKQRGAQAMGFDQDATTHHFLIRPDGGVIQVTAKDSNAQPTIQAIRTHLQRIQSQFSKADFEAPFATHGETPDGVEQMKQLAKQIQYSYQEVGNGAQVVIQTKDPDALHAVHAFLDYQIREHRTGDAMCMH